MCGITGIVWNGRRPIEQTLSVLRSMNAAQAHRGPDGDGVLAGDDAGKRLELWLRAGDCRSSRVWAGTTTVSFGLGHRRLAIIDLSGGVQPLCDQSGQVWVTFNGEIYNYLRLRRELEARGCSFRTNSDTEAIVNAYRVWGEACVEHLEGMFAFAIWDDASETLLLARDRLGIKPLLYAELGGALLFASELKALVASGLVPRQVRAAALKRFLYHLYVPAPEGPVEGVLSLEPGHVLIWKQGRASLRRYWQPSFELDRSRSDAAWIQAFRERLQAAVESHLMSDVPLGAFLSGGLDSSAIVALMSDATARSAGRVHTSTVCFDDPEYDEADDARLVARHLGTDHEEVAVSDAEISGALESVLRCYDQPFADASAVPTYLLCRAARRRVSVALAGDGADELLAGYPRHRYYAALEQLRKVPGLARRPLGALVLLGARAAPERHARKLRNLGQYMSQRGPVNGADLAPGDPLGSYVYLRNVFRNGWYERVTTLDFRQAVRDVDPIAHLRKIAQSSDAPDALSRLLHVELQSYLPNDILQKVDMASMAFGLEVRVPFLDHHLVELVARMPLHLKVNLWRTKVVLRRALANALPRETFSKKKRGFLLPLAPWLRGAGRPIAEGVLFSDRALARGYFDPKGLRLLLDEHLSGTDHSPRLWALLQLEMWHRNYVDT